jgi:glycosyltransferase involved in cell wall biosynthesis
MPLVSVIIPSYNRAALIGRAIDSVLGQTYPDVQVIVVDDGSTDDTRQMLERYDGRVRYIYQHNRGPSAARNRGAAQAEGEYIAFLDSDDTILPTKVAKQVAYLCAHPGVDIVLCGWRAYELDGTTISLETKAISMHRLLEGILLTGIRGLIPLNAPLLRRECFEYLHGFDERLPSREEQDLWIRAILEGHRFGMVREILCTITSTPASYGKDLGRIEQAMPIILGQVFDHPALPRRLKALKSQIYARVYLQLGYRHFGNCLAEDVAEMGLARDDLSKALAFRPHRPAWGGRENLDLLPYRAIAWAGGGDPEASLHRLIGELFVGAHRPRWMEGELRARLHVMLAFQAYQARQRAQVVRHFCRAVRGRPALLANRGLSAIYLRSLMGRFPQQGHEPSRGGRAA